MPNKERTNYSCKLNDLHMQIGKELTSIRQLRNEKQINVAHATGISIGTISKIETGHYNRLNTVLITRLAEYYNTDVKVSFISVSFNAVT